MPNMLVTLVGQKQSIQGIGAVFDVFQNAHMNKSLAFVILESFLSKLLDKMPKRDILSSLVPVDARAPLKK